MGPRVSGSFSLTLYYKPRPQSRSSAMTGSGTTGRGGGGGGPRSHRLTQSLPPESMANGVSSKFLADELNRVEKAQQQLKKTAAAAAADGASSDTSADGTDANAAYRLSSSALSSIPAAGRVPILQRQISELTLTTEYAEYLRTPPKTQSLDDQVTFLLDLASILISHTPTSPPRRQKRTRHDPTRNPPFVRLLLEGYRPLHRRVRALLLLEYRKSIRSSGGSGYPTSSAVCQSLRDSLEQSVAPEWEGGGMLDDFARLTAYLVRVQLHHDALMLHVRARGWDIGMEEGEEESGEHTTSQQRLDVIDELIRPLVRRAEYHFVDESGGQASSDAAGIRMTSSNVSELPRWLIRYVRHALTGESDQGGSSNDGEDDECGIVGVLVDGVLPVVRAEMKALRHGTVEPTDRNGAAPAEDTEDSHRAALVRHHPFASSGTEILLSYLLSEVSSLILHILRRREYICIVSSKKPIISGATALMDGLEQCLRFDAFANELLLAETDGIGVDAVGRHGTAARLLLEYPPLLDLLIDVDRRSGLNDLRGAPTLVPTSSALACSPPSPLAESYASLVTSIMTKSATGLSSSHVLKKRYVAGVAVPVTTFFMDKVHDAASNAREDMVRAVGRRSSDLDLIELQRNIQTWLDLISGMTLAVTALESSPPPPSAAAAVMSPLPFTPRATPGTVPAATSFTPNGPKLLFSPNIIQNTTPATQRSTFRSATPGGQDPDLVRLAQSLRRLRDAMIDEYSSTLVETILMESIGLAGYFMTQPHKLMSNSGIILGGQNVNDLPPSEELERPVELLLAILDTLCLAHSSASASITTEDSMQSGKPRLVDGTIISIITNVGSRIQEKFAEVATDAHGTVPEIQRSGALQFLADVHLIHAVFDSAFDTIKQSTGASLGSLVVLARLMAAKNEEIRSLREVLFELAADSTLHLSPGVSHIPFQPFESDGTLYETAKSMLESKGYVGIDVEDAVSILNRRKVASSAVEALGRL